MLRKALFSQSVF
jgi:isocitrate dehydrogenase